MTRKVPLAMLGFGSLVAGLAFVFASLAFGGKPPGKAAVVAHAASATPSPQPASDELNDVHALSTLLSNGADLAKPTTITHYLYVPELGDARTAVDALERRGFTVVLERPLGAAPGSAVRTEWGVVASRAETPTIEHVRAARTVFEALARRYHGSYDGWEAAVVR
jgi:hypothetical protein